MPPPYTKEFKARLNQLQRSLGHKPAADELRASLNFLLNTDNPDTFFDGYWFLDSEFLKARDHDAAIEAAKIAVRFRRDPMTLVSLSGRLHSADRKAEAKAAMEEAVDLAFRENFRITYTSLAQIRHHLWEGECDEARRAFQRLMNQLSASAALPDDPLEVDVIPGLRQCGVPSDLLSVYEQLAARQGMG